MIKLFYILYTYLYFMRLFKLIICTIVIWSTFFIEYSSAFTKIWNNELEKTQQNTNIILSFFSTQMLLNITFASITIIWTFILSKFVTNKLSHYLENNYAWENSWKEELIWVLTRTINISILVIWIAITLTLLWVDIWIFLWGLWFGIWFTLKIFLTNFIAWILMVTQWFYHLSDRIKVWENFWTIKKIHALFTEIEQLDGIIFYVPNVKFLEENVSNFSSNNKRRLEIKVWVDHETDILKAKKIMIQIMEKFPNILKAPDPDVLIKKIWDSSIELSLRFWVDSNNEYLWLQSNVTETIHLAFKKNWIKIPFKQIMISNR